MPNRAYAPSDEARADGCDATTSGRRALPSPPQPYWPTDYEYPRRELSSPFEAAHSLSAAEGEMRGPRGGAASPSAGARPTEGAWKGPGGVAQEEGEGRDEEGAPGMSGRAPLQRPGLAEWRRQVARLRTGSGSSSNTFSAGMPEGATFDLY